MLALFNIIPIFLYLIITYLHSIRSQYIIAKSSIFYLQNNYLYSNLTLTEQKQTMYLPPLFVYLNSINLMLQLTCDNNHPFSSSKLNCYSQFNLKNNSIISRITRNAQLFIMDSAFKFITQTSVFPFISFPDIVTVFPNTISLSSYSNTFFIELAIQPDLTLNDFKYQCIMASSNRNYTTYHYNTNNKDQIICDFSNESFTQLDLTLFIRFTYQKDLIEIKKAIKLQPVYPKRLFDYYPKLFIESHKEDTLTLVFSRQEGSTILLDNDLIKTIIIIRLYDSNLREHVIYSEELYSSFIYSHLHFKSVLNNYFKIKQTIYFEVMSFNYLQVNPNKSYIKVNQDFFINNYDKFIHNIIFKGELYYEYQMILQSYHPSHFLIDNEYIATTLYYSNSSYPTINDIDKLNITPFCISNDNIIFQCFDSVNVVANSITLRFKKIAQASEFIVLFIPGLNLSSFNVYIVPQPIIYSIKEKNYIVNSANKKVSIQLFGKGLIFEEDYKHSMQCKSAYLNLTAETIKVHSINQIECIFSSIPIAKVVFVTDVIKVYNDEIQYRTISSNTTEVKYHNVDIEDYYPVNVSPYSNNTIYIQMNNDYDNEISFIYCNNVIPFNKGIKANVYIIQLYFVSASLKQKITVAVSFSKNNQYQKDIYFDIMFNEDVSLSNVFYLDSNKVVMKANLCKSNLTISSCIIDYSNRDYNNDDDNHRIKGSIIVYDSTDCESISLMCLLNYTSSSNLNIHQLIHFNSISLVTDYYTLLYSMNDIDYIDFHNMTWEEPRLKINHTLIQYYSNVFSKSNIAVVNNRLVIENPFLVTEIEWFYMFEYRLCYPLFYCAYYNTDKFTIEYDSITKLISLFPIDSITHLVYLSIYYHHSLIFNRTIDFPMIHMTKQTKGNSMLGVFRDYFNAKDNILTDLLIYHSKIRYSCYYKDIQFNILQLVTDLNENIISIVNKEKEMNFLCCFQNQTNNCIIGTYNKEDESSIINCVLNYSYYPLDLSVSIGIQYRNRIYQMTNDSIIDFSYPYSNISYQLLSSYYYSNENIHSIIIQLNYPIYKSLYCSFTTKDYSEENQTQIYSINNEEHIYLCNIPPLKSSNITEIYLRMKYYSINSIFSYRDIINRISNDYFSIIKVFDHTPIINDFWPKTILFDQNALYTKQYNSTIMINGNFHSPPTLNINSKRLYCKYKDIKLYECKGVFGINSIDNETNSIIVEYGEQSTWMMNDTFSIELISINTIGLTDDYSDNVIIQSKTDISSLLKDKAKCNVNNKLSFDILRTNDGRMGCDLKDLKYTNISDTFNIHFEGLVKDKYPINLMPFHSFSFQFNSSRFESNSTITPSPAKTLKYPPIVFNRIYLYNSSTLVITGRNFDYYANSVIFLISEDKSNFPCSIKSNKELICSHIPNNTDSLISLIQLHFHYDNIYIQLFLIYAHNFHKKVILNSDLVFYKLNPPGANYILFQIKDKKYERSLEVYSSIRIKLDKEVINCRLMIKLLLCNLNEYFNHRVNNKGLLINLIEIQIGEFISVDYPNRYMILFNDNISMTDIISVDYDKSNYLSYKFDSSLFTFNTMRPDFFHIRENENKIKDKSYRINIENGSLYLKFTYFIIKMIQNHKDLNYYLYYKNIPLKRFNYTSLGNNNVSSSMYLCNLDDVNNLIMTTTANMLNSNITLKDKIESNELVLKQSAIFNDPIFSISYYLYDFPKVILLTNLDLIYARTRFDVEFTILYSPKAKGADFICVVTELKSKTQIISVGTNSNTCMNLYCTIHSTVFHLEIKWVHDEKDNIVFYKQFECLQPINQPSLFISYDQNEYNETTNESKLPLGNSLYFREASKLTQFTSNVYHMLVRNKNDSFYDDQNSTNTKGFEYICSEDPFISNNTDPQITERNRVIMSSQSTTVMNYDFDFNEVNEDRVLAGKAKGLLFGYNENVMVKITTNPPYIIKCNITVIEENAFEFKFRIPSNIDLIGQYNLLISQYDNTFNSIQANDMVITFIKSLHLDSYTPKMIKYNGGTLITFSIENFIDDFYIDKDKFNCVFYYGIGTIITTSITFTSVPTPPVYAIQGECLTPDLSSTTQIRHYSKMRIEKETSKFFRTNYVILTLYKSSTAKSIFPLFYSLSTTLKAEITLSSNYFVFNPDDIKCKINDIILQGHIVLYNQTISCDLPSDLFTSETSVNILYSFNAGVDWEDTKMPIKFFVFPRFTSVSQSSDDIKGGFNIILIGNGFQNAKKDLFCLYQSSSGTFYSIGVFTSSQKIICSNAPSEDKNNDPYKILISYSKGLETIDSGFTIQYHHTHFLIKNIFPLYEIVKKAIDISLDIDLYHPILNQTELDKHSCYGFEYNDFVLDENHTCLAVSERDYSTNEELLYSNIEVLVDKKFHSNQNILFYKLNITFESGEPFLGPKEGNTIILFKGNHFIMSSDVLKLRFNGGIDIVPEYLNSTYIRIKTLPVITPSIEQIEYTVNGITYHPIEINRANIEYKYYNEVEIISITPSVAYVDDETIVLIKTINGIDNPLLKCKANNLVIQGELVITGINQYVKCILPPFTYISEGKVNPTDADRKITISISNNNQQYSPPIQFEFISNPIDALSYFHYYPMYGPEFGGSELTFFSNNFIDVTNPSHNVSIIPKCIFGDVIQDGYYFDPLKNTIKCTSPPLNAISIKDTYIIGDLFLSIVNLTLKTHDRDIPLTYVYNTNVTLFQFFPNNVEINKDINIDFIGSSFFYFSNLTCKFTFDDGDIQLIKAISVLFTHFTCKTPLPSKSTPQKARVTYSLNGYDYYSFNDNIFYYRNSECIVRVSPSIIPISSFHENIINVTTDYYFDANHISSYCVLSNNKSLYDSNYTLQFHSKSGLNSNKVTCQVPILKDLSFDYYQNGGKLYLHVSSNGINFCNDAKNGYPISLYAIPAIVDISKLQLPIDQLFELFVTGKNFKGELEGKLRLSCGNTDFLFTTVFVTDSLLYVPFNQITGCDHDEIIDIALTYDEINYYYFEGVITAFKQHEIISVFPDVIIKQHTTVVKISIKSNILWKIKSGGSITYKCDWSTLGIQTNGKIISNTVIYCDDINLLPFTTSNAKMTLLINTDDPITETFSFTIVDKETISNNSMGSLLKTYQLNKDIIKLAMNRYDNNGLYYLKIGNYIIKMDTIESGIGVLVFIRDKELRGNVYDCYLSRNLNDWGSSISQLDIHTLLQCANGVKCLDDKNIYQHSNDFICQKGGYCIKGIFRYCMFGTYNNVNNRDKCIDCPIGKQCIDYGLSEPQSCLNGYQCNVIKIRSRSQLIPCPEGFICDGNTINYDISSGLINTVGYLYSCPNGFYCPKATYTTTSNYNVIGSPQYCLDGIACGQNPTGATDAVNSGSINQFGFWYCPIGKYCIKGRLFNCKEGTECIRINLDHPDKCSPGMYLSLTLIANGVDACVTCTIGSFCFGDGSLIPKYCNPGRLCQETGLHRPSGYCPGGYYCIDSTIGFPKLNDTLPTLTQKYYPQECSTGQLCIGGITTSITDENNPEAPQPCRAGIVCENGSSTGSKLCPIGHYCPGNTNPIPAPPGTYVPGEGFIQPLDCAPGYYNDKYAQIECQKCLSGSYAYLQGQTSCILCEAGSYRSEDMTSINCAMCPPGTYNEKQGSKLFSDCLSCPPAYLCDIEGLSDFIQQAKICPEGYICLGGTNTNNILLCPEGFYCTSGTSELFQYHICPQGYYCEKGTASSNYKKNPCPVGWYCPRGTYIENGEIYISLILNQVLQAKLQHDPNDPDLIEIECDENKDIPDEFLQLLTSLQCPSGTSSLQGAICVGQCIKLNDNPSNIIDPLHPDSYNQNYTTVDDNVPSPKLRLLTDSRKYLEMQPFEIIYLDFDFTSIPSYMTFNKHYSISIQTNKGIQTLPSYLTDTSFTYPESKIFKFKLFNFNQEAQSLIISANINNGIFSSLEPLFKNSATIKRYLPYRSIKETNKMFTFFLLKETFSSQSLSLPYNFYSNYLQESTGQILIDYSSTDSNFTYDHKISEKDPYLIQDFEDFPGIFLPWIPFLSNCASYDYKLILYDLLENSPYCNFPKSDSIIIINAIPYTGFTPVSDTCAMSLRCRYDEINQNVISNKWFSLLKEEVLAYLSSEPLSIVNITNSRASFVEEEIRNHEKSFIPVKFTPNRNGNLNTKCFPKNLEINIEYYQYSTTSKRLVNMEVMMSNYEFCMNETSKDNVDPFYNVSIKYYPLGYFDLINKYQFSYWTYLFLILMMGIMLTSIMFFHWALANCYKKLKETPTLKLITFYKFFLHPCIMGFIYSITPIASIIAFIYAIEISNWFYSFGSTWSSVDNGGFNNVNEQIEANIARTSISFAIASFSLFFYVVHKFVPLPNDKEKLKHDKEKLLNKDENDLSIDSFLQDGNIDADVNMSVVINWKQKMVLVKFFLCTCYIIIKMEYVYSDIISSNIVVTICLMSLIDHLVDEFLLKMIFDESLISTPVLCVNKVTQFLLIVGTKSFGDSLLCYIITLIINALFRMYLEPIYDRCEYLLWKKMQLYSKKPTFIGKCVKYLMNQPIENLDDELNEEIETAQYLQNKQKWTIEPIMRNMLSFSLSITSRLTVPLCLIILWIFEKETDTYQSFKMQSTDLYYYIIFSVAIIIPEIIIEMYITNFVEMIYGFNIQYYLSYCDYRYKFRTSGFIQMRETIDNSLITFWRSLDSMLFSEQYYFILFLSSTSIIFMFIAVEIALRHEYNPFDEPMLFVMLALFSSSFAGLYLIFKLLAYFGGIFASQKSKLNSHDGNFLDFVKVDSNIKDITKFMTTDLFRQKFINIPNNKSWLIENLAFVLGIDKIGKEINETNEKIEEKLNSMYQQAINYQAIDKQIQSKKDFIKKDLQLMPYNQQIEGEANEIYGIRLDISKDSVIDEPNARFGHIEIKNKGYIESLCSIWKNKAKEVIRFKIWSIDVINEIKGEYCEKCNSTFNLQVFQQIDFMKLIKNFKKEYVGVVFTMSNWQEYFSKNQRFETLCMECAYLRNSKYLLSKQMEIKTRKVFDEDINIENLIKMKLPTKSMLYMWLFEARAKILIDEMKKKESENKK